MASVTFLASVDADPRPTCVLDLAKATGDLTASNLIVHRNHALQAQDHLHDDIREAGTTNLHAWTTDKRSSKPISTKSGHSLHTYTIQDRWKVIQWIALEETCGTDEALQSTRADRDDAAERLQCLLKMMEMVDVGIFEYDKKGKLVYANDAFYNLSGHPRETTKQEGTWLDSVFPEDKEWLMGQWTQLVNGTSLTFEMRWKRPATSMPNGEEDLKGSWVLAACVPTFDDHGEITSISGCLTDIRLQKQSHCDAMKRAEALERAAASERRFSNFAENLNVGIWILNMDMKVSKRYYTKHPLAPTETAARCNIVIPNGSL